MVHAKVPAQAAEGYWTIQVVRSDRAQAGRRYVCHARDRRVAAIPDRHGRCGRRAGCDGQSGAPSALSPAELGLPFFTVLALSTVLRAPVITTPPGRVLDDR